MLKRLRLALVAAVVALAPVRAHAGGGPERVLLVIDPSQPDSIAIGHYYQRARGVPASHVVYMPPGATDYSSIAALQLPAVLGAVEGRGLADQIDFVVIAGTDQFQVSAPNLVASTNCVPMRRVSLSAAYSLIHLREAILGGGLTTGLANGYYSSLPPPRAFSASTAWRAGAPSTDAQGTRYLIGMVLGYVGTRGNTVPEVIRLIDRSIQADASRPTGTFYLMRTSDRIRSGTRDLSFPAEVGFLRAAGATGEIVEGDLPLGRHDALGVMTGVARTDILGADMTLLPGAIADHLTSYAATFDEGSQTKASEWIAKGASGTAGTVEEPCAIPGKFPHATVFTQYA
jgi:uncharacterized protein (TIGR03790 family)